MELEFLDDAAPELSAWIAARGNCLFEEQPRARHAAASELHAAEAEDWSDSEDASE